MNEIIWNPRYWLPKNYTWDDLVSANPKLYYGRPKDLIYSVYIGFVLFFLRIIVERYIWKPIGHLYGLSHRKYVKVEYNRYLEREYKRNKRPNNDAIKRLSKTHNDDENYLHRWFRRRRNQDKSDILTKFTECGWRFAYYLSVFVVGCWVIHDQEFIWDTRLMWNKVPFNPITPLMFWYIMVELAYYLSSIVTYFFDVKRKDFWQMLLHHIATVSLIILAWIQNYIPVSLYILCIHDLVDYIMEAAKMFKYIKKDLWCNILFVVFTLAWFFSRLIVYPMKIVYSAFYETDLNSLGAVICRIFLVLLQVLHIMWFIMILKVAVHALDKTGVDKDTRSDSEMSLSDSEPKNNNKPSNKDNMKDR